MGIIYFAERPVHEHCLVSGHGGLCKDNGGCVLHIQDILDLRWHSQLAQNKNRRGPISNSLNSTFHPPCNWSLPLHHRILRGERSPKGIESQKLRPSWQKRRESRQSRPKPKCSNRRKLYFTIYKYLWLIVIEKHNFMFGKLVSHVVIAAQGRRSLTEYQDNAFWVLSHSFPSWLRSAKGYVY